MPLEKFKQYQNQIASTFHRFPVAIAFALIATFIFLHLYHTNDLHKIFELESENARLYLWLSIYPISAVFISVTLKLLQEARGHLHLSYKVTKEKTEQVKSDSAEQNTNADNSEVRDDDAEESVKAVNNTTGATEDIRVSVYSSSWEPSQIPNSYKTFRKINGYVKTENAKIVNDTLTFTLTTVRDRDTCAAFFTYSVPVKQLKA